MVFQPHRYTRTLDLMDEFQRAFNDADTVIVLPIYAASEEPIPGVTAERLAERHRRAAGRDSPPIFRPPSRPCAAAGRATAT